MKKILMVQAGDMAHFQKIAGKEYQHIIDLTPVTLHALSKKLKRSVVCLDLETTSYNPRYGLLLLSTWYFPHEALVVTIVHGFDRSKTYEDLKYLREAYRTCLMIAHNASFEYNWLNYYKMDRPQELWCTMVADQKLHQGHIGKDYMYNLVDTLDRRQINHNINKTIRMDFNTMTSCTDIELKHLLYNQQDTLPLYELYILQYRHMEEQNQVFWIRHVHMKLAMILMDMEMEGMVLNQERWMEHVQEARTELTELEQQLDQYADDLCRRAGTDLKDILSPAVKDQEVLDRKKARLEDRLTKCIHKLEDFTKNNKKHLKAFKTVRESYLKARKELDDLDKEQISPKINWGSQDQIMDLLKGVGFSPIPVAMHKEKRRWLPSFSKAARQSWILNNLGHPDRKLIELLTRYSIAYKHLSSFGENFITNYYQPLTGKVHTNYKQGTVNTGRLASGNVHGDPPTYNSQQLMESVRSCFGTDDGYLVATCDLSGAELITMCSLAQDHKLLALSKGDMHSYFANKGWKAIHESRGESWTDANIISKQQNLEKRTSYKNMTFGTIYGLKPNKAAETLNVTPKEGAIAIQTIIREIPDTISMVKDASAFALKYGYVVHNTRTNSRRWFTEARELYLFNKDLPEYAQRDLPERQEVIIAQAARNTRIQGTQADMLNEALVELDRYIRLYRLDIKILKQVHDEIVVKFREDYKDWFPERLRQIMIRTANRYLNNVTMKADLKVGLTWMK